MSSGSVMVRSGSADWLDLSSLQVRDDGGPAAVGSSSVTRATLRKFVTSNPPPSALAPIPDPRSCIAPKLLRFLGAPAERPTSFHRLRFSFSTPADDCVPSGGVFSRSTGEHAVSGEVRVEAREIVDPAAREEALPRGAKIASLLGGASARSEVSIAGGDCATAGMAISSHELVLVCARCTLEAEADESNENEGRVGFGLCGAVAKGDGRWEVVVDEVVPEAEAGCGVNGPDKSPSAGERGTCDLYAPRPSPTCPVLLEADGTVLNGFGNLLETEGASREVEAEAEWGAAAE